jgi:hypothetical protein
MCETFGSSDWRNSSINSATMDVAEDAFFVVVVVVVMVEWSASCFVL